MKRSMIWCAIQNIRQSQSLPKCPEWNQNLQIAATFDSHLKTNVTEHFHEKIWSRKLARRVFRNPKPCETLLHKFHITCMIFSREGQRKSIKTSPWFQTISSWKQQHLALVTSQEGSRNFCYVITPKTAVTRAEKHPGHVHYAGQVYARRFSIKRENKAELMSRWREEQKEKKKAIKRAH